jgi:hypothetical protein
MGSCSNTVYTKAKLSGLSKALDSTVLAGIIGFQKAACFASLKFFPSIEVITACFEKCISLALLSI